METAVIVSVLLSFLKQGFSNKEVDRRVYKRLLAQVWIGAVLGLVICLFVGAFIIFAFYYLGKNLWNATEKVWEATFSLIASVMITIMGLAMLRINRMQEKWRVKLAKNIIETHEGTHKHKHGLKYLSKKYAMALLPLITTLREGLEAVVFLGGIGANQPASSFPLPVIVAIFLGLLIGYLMYTSGNHVSIHYFLVGSTCFLYLVAAGLFSRGVWFIELQQFINHVGQDVSEMGSGPGSYDVSKSVWHVNCCNSQTDGPWMIFNAVLGWQNSATYGSVISYNLYWAFVIALLFSMRYRERHGYFPIIPRALQRKKKDLHNYTEEERNRLLQRATEIYAGAGEQRQSVDSTTPLVPSGN
ncbi:plasma membrane iron permease [Trichomonascus vanleenenianus]|uniref:FTR1 family protein n=1 Tax=Trichomonascus vanleenenianus TaxID=2268995 RepID=UPI003ECB8FD7